MRRFKFLLAGLVMGFILPGVARAQSDNLASYRAVFSWELTEEVATEISYFALMVDSDVVFAEIPNLETAGDNYSLILDNTNHQYQLIFEDQFSVGDHYWQVVGATDQQEAIFNTTPAVFRVEASSWDGQSLSLAVWHLLTDSRDLLVTAFVSLGSVLFFVLFGLFFGLDLFFSRGVSLASRRRSPTGIRRSGFVFETATGRGVPFAILTIKGHSLSGEEVLRTSVTDVEGMYNSIAVPRGDYQLVVQRQGYTFPTQKSRAVVVPMEEFYKGETFHIVDEHQQIDPLIPMDKIAPSLSDGRRRFDWRTDIWQYWQSLTRLQPYFEVVLAIMSVVGLLVRPSWLFIITAVFYTFLVVRRLIGRLARSSLYGVVMDNHGVPIAGAIVEVYQQNDTDRQEVIAVSDEYGRFRLRLAPGTYQTRAKKNGFVSQSQARAVNADETVEITSQRQTLVITLTQVPKLTEDFFWQDTPADPASSVVEKDSPTT